MGSLPKTKKNNIPKSIHGMSKEMLQETLKKKKECNAKALWTVEKLCEADIDEEWFLANLQFINQCHFDDVTVERAISKICGYPLCDQELIKVPAQQYHISTRYNKVFDITERKNFCSSSCYKSAMHVKMQLLTSPLWLRDVEVLPKFTILKSSKSSMGEEVVFFPDKVKLEAEDMKKIDSRNRIILDENIALEKKFSNLNIFVSGTESENKTKTNVLKNIKTYDENVENNLNEKIKSTDQGKAEDKDANKPKAINNTMVHNIVKEDQTDICTAEKGKTSLKNNDNIIFKIEKSIFEWFSIDTVFYLYKEEKLKELFQDKSIKIKEFLNKELFVPDYNKKLERMIQLYELLGIDSFSNSENKVNLKPLPDYSSLKEEGKNLEIKVRAFYQGNLEVTMPSEEIKEEHQDNHTISNPNYLPLIDAHAQVALRRKIVLDKLNKVIPELIKLFSSDFVLKMSEVRGLVANFSLTAHNITFKPAEWYLMGIIIIKLLCLRDKELDSIMKLESSENQMLLILKNYGLPKDYLDELLLRLIVDENLLNKLSEINK